MSGEETEPVPGSASHDSENGMSNSGFDPLSAGDHDSMSGTNISTSHSGNQQTDWKKYADESFQHYLSGCPGAYGGNRLPSEQQKVCFFYLYRVINKSHRLHLPY